MFERHFVALAGLAGLERCYNVQFGSCTENMDANELTDGTYRKCANHSYVTGTKQNTKEKPKQNRARQKQKGKNVKNIREQEMYKQSL